MYHCGMTWLVLRVSSDNKTCTNLLSRKNATSYTTGLCRISNTSVISEHAFWQMWQQKKNAPTGEQSICLCCPNDRMFLCRLRVRQTTRQPPPFLVHCMQTSLHLSKHVALFRRFVSRGLPAFFRTPGSQPSEVFRHPQNVKFSFPQGDVFESHGIHLQFLYVWVDNCCTCWENKGKDFPKFNVPRGDWSV